VSFDSPEYTSDVDAIRNIAVTRGYSFLGLENGKTRFYQASTSELYGLVQETPTKRNHTVLSHALRMAVAKLYSYWICVNYREAYGMYACNGILFNHESPRRGETFVREKSLVDWQTLHWV